MRLRLLGAASALSLLLAGAGLTGLSPALSPPQAQAAAPNPAPVVGLTDHWKPDIQTDETQLGIRSGIVGLFTNWATASPATVVNWADWVRGRGGAPMLTPMPPGTARLADIADGSQDRYLAPLASALAAWGHPMLLRVLPEMNGSWETYSPGTRGQTPAQFRAAFAHVSWLFRSLGAVNVRMVWNPDRLLGKPATYQALWPGDRWVDWTAFDAYNYQNSSAGRFTPYKLLQPSVAAIRGLTRKPIMLAEVGCAPYNLKPQWVAGLFPEVRWQGIRAAVWFNEWPGGGQPNWRLNSAPSPATLNAAKKVLHGPNAAWPGHGVNSIDQLDRFVLTGVDQ